jgi:hypothetical protein
MGDSDPDPQSYPDRDFGSIANLREQIEIYRGYYNLFPASKDTIDRLIAQTEASIKVLESLHKKGGKRRSKRAHSKRRAHRKSHRKSHRRH